MKGKIQKQCQQNVKKKTYGARFLWLDVFIERLIASAYTGIWLFS